MNTREENIDQVWVVLTEYMNLECSDCHCILGENQYDLQQTTEICVTFLRVIGFLMEILCEYCSIIALSFVCYTCVMCAM